MIESLNPVNFCKSNYGHCRIAMLLLALLFLPLCNLFAQQTRTVNGEVTSTSGEPIPGVNVVVKGTTKGTVTNIDGKYSISTNESDILVFSFVGFESKEVLVGNQYTINVEMYTDMSDLQSVTVTSIGYGEVQEREITSAVVSVSEKNFNQGNVNDPAQLLQGKVAGLSIAKAGADPNAGFNIRLRGLSTFGANSQPLIVIDGVLGGSLQLVDPNDIQSVEVLKDGSAAAIYGTRGGSGVILITTKKPKASAGGTIDYNSYLAIEDVAQFVQNSTPEQFIEAGGQDNGYRTDWLDMVTQTGTSQVHNLSLSNRVNNSSYRASLNYRDIEGVSKGTGFDQLNARFDFNQTALNDKLTLTFTGVLTRRKARFVPYESMRFAIIADPTAPVFNNNDPDQGYWEPNTPEYHNPVGIANAISDEGVFKTMMANMRASYKITNDLDISAFYSVQYESDLRSQYFSSETRFASAAGQRGRASKFTEDRENTLFEITGNYSKQLNKLKVNLLAGYSWQEFEFNRFNAFNTNFITDDLLSNNLGLGLGTATGVEALAGMGSRREESRLIGFFGRAMFNFDEKYFLSATYRREGSSKFGPEERWGNFYAISGGMDFSQIFDTPFDALKLRIGYGLTGNLPQQNYEWRTRLSRGSRVFFNDTRYIQGVNFASNPNPFLKWEEKAETNFGVDFGIFNSRLYGSIDYYVRNTSDVLQSVSVSVPPNFFPSTLLNIGELKSKGLEIALNGTVYDKPGFSYNSGITFSTFDTELVRLDGEREQIFLGNLGPPGLNGINVIRLAEGKPIGDIMAPIFLGLDEAGKRIIQDQNGDGVISQLDDAVVVGNGLPDFEIAWNNLLSYKRFDFNVTFRGAFGHSLVNINRAYYESPVAANNYNPVRTKYYMPELTEGENWNSSYVEKADFVKLDNATIGYNFNVSNSNIRNIRLYATGQNLFVITGYTGVDPEVHYTYGNSPLAPGIDDRNSYFRSRTVTLGVNIGF